MLCKTDEVRGQSHAGLEVAQEEAFPTCYVWAKKEIKVRFKNVIPPYWKKALGVHLKNENEILHIANEWHQCGVNVVPRFIACMDDNPDIVVEFGGKENILINLL